MKQKRSVIIRCRWGSFPVGWSDPPQIPDATLKSMFGKTPSKWGVAQLWHDATLGEIDFLPAVIVDVGPLKNHGFDGSKNPADGSVITPRRFETVEAAIESAIAQGFVFADNDVPVVFIGPPPSDAGGIESTILNREACLLDVGGTQTYMAQEFGHALNFGHSFGPNPPDPSVEYSDPYCVMSGLDFGGRDPFAIGLPRRPLARKESQRPPGLPELFTTEMGPLPAAALVGRYNLDFANSPAVVTVDPSLGPAKLTLTSYGAAVSQSNMVLGIVKTSAHTWFVEYRGAHGWDRGLGQPRGIGQPRTAPPPGIVIHRLDPNGNVCFVAVIDTRLGAGRGWSAPDDHFTVTVSALAEDVTWAEILIRAPQLKAQRIGSETSQHGAALVSVNDVFINENHFVGWTGTGNLRPNFAKSDDTLHQQARTDTANGNLGLTKNHESVWAAFSGTNPGHTLNLFNGTPDNVFNRKILRPGDSSPTGPALAMLNGRLFLAYRGEDNGLYVVADADDPTKPAQRIGAETTMAGPGMTMFGGVLYVAWASTDGNGLLNVISSHDGVNWANKWTLKNETTRFTPAIIGADPGRIYLAWTGTDGAQSLNLGMLEASNLEYPMEEANPNGIFDAKITYPNGSVGGPALASTTRGYDLILAWAGLDGPGNLYSAYIESPFAVPTL